MGDDRSKFIGSTDIAAILGVSPWKKRIDVWLDKVDPQDVDSKVKKRGRRLEGYILDYAQDEFGLQIVQRNLRVYDPKIRHFSAQIDAVTKTCNVQAKSVHPLKGWEWGEAGTDELPMHYVAGEQWTMGLTPEVDTSYVIALIGDDLRKYVVERDQALIDAMRQKAEEFWQTYVVPRVRPPMEYGEHAVEVLRRLYPGTNGQALEATPDLERWRELLHEAQGLVKHYENAAAAAKAHLLEHMGDAALLNFADGKSLRRKSIFVKGYTVEAGERMDTRFVKTPGEHA